MKLQNTKVENGIIIDNDISYSLINDNKLTSNYTYYPLYVSNNIFFRNGLSLFKSKGENLNYIKIILPSSPKEIEKKFNNKCSEYVYDEKNMVYYIRANKNWAIKHIYMYSSPISFLGEVKLLLFKEKSKKTDICDKFPKFQYNDYIYYYFDNIYKQKVYGFEIDYK